MVLPSRRLAAAVPRLAGTGYANGTFGELLQGALPGTGNHFLVTLPIHRFSKVRFFLDPEHVDLRVVPHHKHKAVRLAELLLHRLGLPVRGRLAIESELPEGKGMASSSADLVATARAIFGAIDRPVEEETLLSLLREIEPTDGVMYPEFVSFFHRRVELHQRLGLPGRSMHVLAVDEGGMVDTLAYNRKIGGYSDAERAAYETLLDRACTGFRRSDLRVLGDVATRSAELNQRRNPKRHLTRLHAMKQELGALGVVVTHSGTCAGLLFDDSPAHDQAMTAAQRTLEDRDLEVERLSILDPEQGPWNRFVPAAPDGTVPSRIAP